VEVVKKQERRGGARPNSGPKPEALSAKQLKLMLREVRKRAKKEGKTITGGLLDIFYAEKTADTVKITAAKLLLDKTMIQVTEGGETDKALGPAVYLPGQRPALSVVEGKKTA
jgi:hypothetical protein